MKKFSLFLLSIFCLTSSFGQKYHPLIRPNTNWEIWHFDGTQFCHYSGAQSFFFKGDTIINGINYTALRYYNIISLNPPGNFPPFCSPYAIDKKESFIDSYIYEDTLTRQVFFYEDSNKVKSLLYDFSLSKGDTIKSHYSNQGQVLVIDSVGKIILGNNESRNIFYLNNRQHYIESIGGQGLVYPLIVGLGFADEIRCVTENNFNIWGNSCLGTLNFLENKSNNPFNISINTALGEINLKGIKNKNAIFTIYDLTGRCIIKKCLILENSIIDINGLDTGVYLYAIESDSNNSTVSKFVWTR